MPDTSRASAAVLATQWAIQPDMLSTILAIAERTSVDAILSGNPQRLAGTRTTSIVDGVAVIPVLGPIFPRANMFSDVSGATSIEVLASDFGAALRNPSVHGIVFDIDSPGGAVSGVSELVDVIAAARGVKPIKAYSSGTMASAAYWLASAAGEIVLSATAIAGNVGVVAQVIRDKGDAVQFVSSQSPNKRPSLDTDAGKAEIQRTVDHLAAVFVSSVSRLRGVTDVVARFGAGAVMVGQHAVAAGMADRIGSLAVSAFGWCDALFGQIEKEAESIGHIPLKISELAEMANTWPRALGMILTWRGKIARRRGSHEHHAESTFRSSMPMNFSRFQESWKPCLPTWRSTSASFKASISKSTRCRS